MKTVVVVAAALSLLVAELIGGIDSTASTFSTVQSTTHNEKNGDGQKMLNDLTAKHGPSTTTTTTTTTATTPPLLNGQPGWAELLEKGLDLLDSSMTLEDLQGTLALATSLDEQGFAEILTGLNIAVPGSQQLQNVMKVLTGLLDIITWGSTQLPGGSPDDLVNLISTMDDQSLEQLLQSLNVDPLTPTEFTDAMAILQGLNDLSGGNGGNGNGGSGNSGNGGNGNGANGGNGGNGNGGNGGNGNDEVMDVNAILDLISVMNEQDLLSLIQNNNLNIDPSEVSGILIVLQTLPGLISSGAIPLPSTNVNDLLSLMSSMDIQTMTLFFQGLNIDGFDQSQLTGAMAVLQSLASSGNNVPSGDIQVLLELLSDLDPQTLSLILQSLNSDGLDLSQPGGALTVLQNLISSGAIQLSPSDITSLLNVASSIDPKTLSVVLQTLNNDGMDLSKLGEALTIFQTVQGALADGNFNLLNRTDLNPLTYLDLTGLSDACNGDLNIIVSEVRAGKTWAIRMVDAWAKIPAGVLDGNRRWLGSYDQCLAINPDFQEGSRFETNYCVAGSEDVLMLGMCVPSSCTMEDIYNLTGAVFDVFPMVDLPAINYARCQKEVAYDTKAIAALSICGFILLLMLVSTLFDVICVSPKLRSKLADVLEEEDIGKTENGAPVSSKEGNGVSIRHVEIKFDSKTGEMETHGAYPGYMYQPDGDTEHTDNMPYSGLASKLLLAFSVWTNGKRLLNTKETSDTIGSINGLRFLSMSWVVLTHTFSYGLDSNIFANELAGKEKNFDRLSFLPVSNGFMSVDCLFAMSGLLVSYYFLKEMKSKKGYISYLKFFLSRFWRLTPPYMLVLMLNVSLFRYVADGPMWTPDGHDTEFCKDSWWANLLYINNFVKSENRCLGWSWYMTNDMQFYILSPILIVPLYFSKKIGGLISAIFLIGVTGATAYISYQNELPLSRYTTDIAGKVEDYFELYYIKPYCRMGPYIVGIIVGYALYRTAGKYHMRPITTRLIWTLTTALAFVLRLSIHPDMAAGSSTVAAAAIYNSVHKTLWGVCMCWVVFACVTGHAGFVDPWLSWSAFVPLRRLTYCAYLVHPLIIAAYNRSRRQNWYMTDMNLLYMFLGHLTLSYVVALVVFLACQAPLMGIERAFTRKVKDEEKENEDTVEKTAL